jgi:glycosyltransferase involved in cell wall biosynthesis
MRVLMLAQWYPPIVGGEEFHTANLSRALVERGHDVTVATLSQQGLADEEWDDGVRVVRMSGALQRIEALFADAGRRSAAPIADPTLALSIDRLVRLFRPDVMHAHNWLVHAALPVRSARGIPLVQTLHDFSLVCAQKVLLRYGRPCSGPGPLKCLGCTANFYGPIKGPVTAVSNWSDGLLQRRLVDLFIPVSRAVAEGTGVVHLQHRVIPNFVPDKTALPPEPGAYISRLPAVPYFLFVGALARLKGLDVLLGAYRVDASLPPLVVIGYQGRESEELLRELPPNVVVLGQWPREAVQLAWSGAIAGVVPSICQEACPTVAIEAMRAGRPTIASNLGGSIDLINDGVTGILVDPGNTDSLLAALRRLAARPALAASMGEHARERSAAFTASSIVPQIERAYQDVIDRSRRGQKASAPGRGALPG